MSKCEQTPILLTAGVTRTQLANYTTTYPASIDQASAKVPSTIRRGAS